MLHRMAGMFLCHRAINCRLIADEIFDLLPTDNRKHSIAGGVAGSVAVLLLHPFDVIKTRLQGVLPAQHACIVPV